MKSWVEQGTKLEKIEIVLTNCIKEIKSGKASLADCLNRYASVRQELEPLLKVALNIEEPQVLNLDSNYKQAAKARLLQQIRPARQKKSRSFTDIFSLGLPARFVWARVAVSIVVVVIMVSMLAGGTAYAAQSSLPGDLLYPVKIGTEQFRRLLETDDVAEVELELAFAGTRLAEIEKLANKAPDKAPMAVIGYEKSIETAIEKAGQITDIGVSGSMLELGALTILEHISTLDRIEDSVSEAATNTVRQAKEIAVGEQVKALRSLAQRDPLRAAEMNIYTMQNRLQRASDTADKGEATKVEAALRQFTQLHRFGEEIIQIAKGLGHGATAVDELNARATHDQMEVLGNIYGKVSDEAMASVEEVMGIFIEDHGKEGEGSPENGARDDIPGKSDDLSEEPGNGPEEPGNGSEGSGNGPGGSGNGSEGSGNGPKGIR